MSTPAAEAEGSETIGPETALVPTAPGAGVAPIDRWVEGDMEQALKRLELRNKMLDALRTAAIAATDASDWIVHTSMDPEGNVVSQVAYLQDRGAERAAKVWGIEIGQPAIEFEKFEDGTFAYHMVAEAWSKITGERLEYVEGSRWSGDQFFQNQVKKDGDRIDPIDVRKSAYTNLHGRAVRSLAGINGVQIEKLVRAGIDTKKCQHITYGRGTSSVGVGGAELVIKWGKSKGKKLAELEERDLNYYLQAEEKNLSDPSKEKWRKQTQTMVDALKAEQERRKNAAEQAAETGTAAPAADCGCADAPNGIHEPGCPQARTQTLGQKRTALHVRLNAILGSQRSKMAQVLRALTKPLGAEKDSLVDFSEAELEALLDQSDDYLKAIAAEVLKGGSK